ncbi:hypothetical protein FH972_021034 [Carpinus fangiana]|uniref:Transcription factor domain-containing protein n=1 Tax=Carpinus fangiana TaxID=176857 RepID=A0A5N6KNR3_9ROSI|nr:hypothetical protein FH972_021034 [Carpinus fangiana]
MPLRSLFVSSLCDAPHLKVVARPWTTVTADDDLISHLVSLWFTWHPPFIAWIDQDLFVRDMQSGNPAAPFCSKFLVNAICAQACPYSQYPESYARTGDRSTSGLHFLEEAKQELDRERGRVSLTTLQGLGILYSVLCAAGKDRQGWVYFGQLARSYNEYLASPEDCKLMAAIRCSTIAWQRPPEVQLPKRPCIPAQHSAPGSSHLDWIPYPQQAPMATIHDSCYMEAHCRASLILRDINMVLFPSPMRAWNDGRLAAVEQHLAALHDWHGRLPDCLQFRAKATPPCNLSLHTIYYGAIITVLGQARVALRSKQVTMTRTEQSFIDDSIRAAIRVSELAESLRTSWGAERMSTNDAHVVMLAMFALLDGTQQEEEQRRAFERLCRAALVAARIWVLAKGQLRLLQLTARHMNVRLPPVVEGWLGEFERNVWTRDDVARYSSMYLNYALLVQAEGASRGGLAMDALLRKSEVETRMCGDSSSDRHTQGDTRFTAPKLGPGVGTGLQKGHPRKGGVRG